ncbi:hypothetical protein PVAND_008571 [Polypedilum vanderplanki]|uniref:Ubiquinone biosynthesis protein COQ4 homolog, mitochondrial n=1 Tax=Polypedilum vanderplanki TaxID=319348 RepID=A0A9J6C9Z8_POLVA|nr:hypothetical protein PVAND_008571 [Polypedilum vanderplanki]
MQTLQKLSKIVSTARINSQRRIITSSLAHIPENQIKNDAESQIDKFTKEFNERKIEISDFQRALLAVGSSVSALLDPRRHDMIACLGETTGDQALMQIYEKMMASEEGRQIISEKPRINTKTVNLDELKIMPENTLGYQYWKFLNDNQVTPDSRLDVRFMDDPMLAYVMTRYREVHDLIHTVLGMKTNMLGEVAVKWVEALNTGLPMCYGGAIFGAMRLKTKHRKLYQQYYLPWALKNGRNTKPLMNVYWEKRWQQDIGDIQKELRIELLPPIDLL